MRPVNGETGGRWAGGPVRPVNGETGGRCTVTVASLNASYFAMFNIAELVPPPESVPIPFASAIHGIPYRNPSQPSHTCIVLCSKVSPQYVDAILVRNSRN